jgi:sulfotransferase
MKKVYHFMSGLPRSGSTVFASILNQNPDVYVTPTSPMLNVAVKMQEIWASDATVKANYFEEQINNLTKAILPAFWEHRKEPIIIDKGRGWAKNMPTANELFGYKIKVIVVHRDLPSVMASWLTIMQANSGGRFDKSLRIKRLEVTNENRMIEIWEGVVKDCMEGLKQIRQEAKDQIVEVSYDEIVNNPQDAIHRVETFLELPKWNYDFNNIINDTQDNDLLAYGFDGLHRIRPSLKKIARHPKEVLGERLYNRFVELEKQYI